jgi:hypothetical protein
MKAGVINAIKWGKLVSTQLREMHGLVRNLGNRGWSFRKKREQPSDGCSLLNSTLLKPDCKSNLAAANPAAAKIIIRRLIPATIIRRRSCGFGSFQFFVILFHLKHLLSYLNLTTKLKNSRSNDEN